MDKYIIYVLALSIDYIIKQIIFVNIIFSHGYKKRFYRYRNSDDIINAIWKKLESILLKVL